MKGTRLRRWAVSLAIGCGLASVFSVQLAGPAAGQYFQPTGGNFFNDFTYGPGTFSGFGFPGFGGIFFPTATPTGFTQVVPVPTTAQPTALPYLGYRGVPAVPYGYTTPAYTTTYAPVAAAPEQQQQEQQQAVQSPGVVVTQSQQQQQQSSGGGYGGWYGGGGSNQQEQQQQQQIS